MYSETSIREAPARMEAQKGIARAIVMQHAVLSDPRSTHRAVREAKGRLLRLLKGVEMIEGLAAKELR